MEFINVAPDDNAYTPAMKQLKVIIEEILTAVKNKNIADISFRDIVEADIKDLQGAMSTLLMQDILYKAGVPYSYEDFNKGARY